MLILSTDGICPDPFLAPQTPDENPVPLDQDKITMEEFTKYFDVNVTKNEDAAGNYTCLRIQYEISANGKYIYKFSKGPFILHRNCVALPHCTTMRCYFIARCCMK